MPTQTMDIRNVGESAQSDEFSVKIFLMRVAKNTLNHLLSV